MSEIKVNKITPRAACGTTQLGDSGDTFTVPAGATISNLGTATGFGGTGVVSWDTGAIKTTGFTAVTGTGYFCNTTGGGFTVTLPLSPSAGDVIGVADYAQTFDTDNLTLGRNGSNIAGAASDSILTTEGIAVTLVYVDGTKGWIVTDSGLQTDAPGPLYIAASGGCITTCGNYKMHKFISPNTFVVCSVGNPVGSDTVDYLVIGGGGSGGTYVPGSPGSAGGGGAGGFRESKAPGAPWTASPLASAISIPVTATPYSIQVGGGASAAGPAAPSQGNKGTDSSFSTITSTGGGYGGNVPGCPGNCGGPGGSGGGAGGTGANAVGGTGNTPTQTPAQGKDGGDASHPGAPNYGTGGGGGATEEGADGTPTLGGRGGAGATTCISASPVAYAGGGGGSTCSGGTAGAGSPCGTGGAGKSTPGAAEDGDDNTGGGGGGHGSVIGCVSGAGGSGIVIIRYKYQ